MKRLHVSKTNDKTTAVMEKKSLQNSHKMSRAEKQRDAN